MSDDEIIAKVSAASNYGPGIEFVALQLPRKLPADLLEAITLSDEHALHTLPKRRPEQ
jgi:hypothetical protein